MTASFLALIQFVTFDKKFRVVTVYLVENVRHHKARSPPGGGRGVLPYMRYHHHHLYLKHGKIHQAFII